MPRDKFRKICAEVDAATEDLEKANKNAERVMLDVVLDLNKDLLNQKGLSGLGSPRT